MKKYLRFALVAVLLAAFSLLWSSTISAARVVIPVADAASIYSAKCAKCHGQDGSGVEKYKKKGQKSFADAAWQKSRTDAQLIKSITNGKGEAMPGWKEKLSAEEIKAVVALVRSLGK